MRILTLMRGEQPTGTLTPRQRATILLIARGLTWREVAYELGISRDTVRNHRNDAMSRYGAVSTIDLLGKLGWLTVPEE